MSDTEQAPAKPHFIFRLFGWTFATLSVLNLIEDLRVIELKGFINQWAEAYGSFVSTAGHFLFGWIEWQWIKVEILEYHVLVIAALLGGTVGRASYATLIRRKHLDPVSESAGLAVGVMVLTLIIILLLPQPWSLWIGSGLTFFGVIGVATRDDNTKDPDVDPWDLLREFFVVAAIFLAVIAANFVLFS